MAGTPGCPIFLLLLCAFGQVSPYSTHWKPTWPAYRLPVVLPQSTFNLAKPDLGLKPSWKCPPCGPQCHKGTPLPTYEEAKQYLSYDPMPTAAAPRRRWASTSSEATRGSLPGSRRKRQIYGYDSRFSIFGKDFLLNYPFDLREVIHGLHRHTGGREARAHSRPLHPRRQDLRERNPEAPVVSEAQVQRRWSRRQQLTPALPEKMKFQWIR